MTLFQSFLLSLTGYEDYIKAYASDHMINWSSNEINYGELREILQIL